MSIKRKAVLLARYFVEVEYEIHPCLQLYLCERYCRARGIEVVGELNGGAFELKSELAALRLAGNKARANQADIVTLDDTYMMTHKKKYRRLKADLMAAGVAVISIGAPIRKRKLVPESP